MKPEKIAWKPCDFLLYIKKIPTPVIEIALFVG